MSLFGPSKKTIERLERTRCVDRELEGGIECLSRMIDNSTQLETRTAFVLARNVLMAFQNMGPAESGRELRK